VLCKKRKLILPKLWLLTPWHAFCCCRDPAKRPSAKEALKHPWLQGNSTERSIGKQIDVSVVARIQRFAQNNRFKRSVLRLIAEELLSRPGALAAETALQAEAAVVAAAAADRSGSGRGRDQRYDPDTGNPIIKDPNSRTMQDIFKKLELTGDAVDRERAALALSKLGYRLEPCEITRLLEQVDTSNSGKVKRAALAASQIDWRHLQQNHMDTWLDIARRAFAALDHNGDGLLHVGDIMSSLKAKLPHDELRHTIQQAMQEAGHGGERGDLGGLKLVKLCSLCPSGRMHEQQAICRRPVMLKTSAQQQQQQRTAHARGCSSSSACACDAVPDCRIQFQFIFVTNMCGLSAVCVAVCRGC
jgi:calcium-dependent protein kinase